MEKHFLEARIPPQTPPTRENPKRNPAEFQKSVAEVLRILSPE